MLFIYLFMLFNLNKIFCNILCIEKTNDTLIIKKENCKKNLKSKIQSTFSMTTCQTSSGEFGYCANFLHCYPHMDFRYIQTHFIKDLLPCTYISQDNTQTQGFCCGNLSNLLQIPASTLLQIINKPIINYPQIINTKPPNHTIMSTTTIKITTPIDFLSNNSGEVSTINHYSCGVKNIIRDQERIVGGQNADIGEWTWIAALFLKGRQHCGGSLISNQHVLSAAHCVAHMTAWDVQNLIIRLGDYNIKSINEVNHLDFKAKKIVRHRGFDSRTLYNDISIITLDQKVEFTKQIRPICLPDTLRNYEGLTGTVIGWGSLRESGPQPGVLQEVNVPIWSNSICRQKYGLAAPGGIVEHMLCAGQMNRDSCSGDSGGPLMINNGHWIQIGIVSWGIGCGTGQYPGVYTRVSNFLLWLKNNMK